MAEEKKNAQVLNGVNDDITELKSLSTLRKRVISDGEVVSKSANAFRLAYGNTGVILRSDGQDFYALTTPSGQAQDGQWNTLRPLSFNLSTGRVSLRNGVEVSGGAVVSSNAGIAAVVQGPTPLINGQTYGAPEIHTDFTSGNKTTSMIMSSRVVPGKEDMGLISYLDFQGGWNEIQLKGKSELSVGQLVKRNTDGWILATGTQFVNNNADRYTKGVRIQGENGLSSELYHYERIGKNNLMGIHVASASKDAWYEFLDTGYAYTNGGWNSSSDARMKTDIVKIDGALDKLGKISGYTYLKQGIPEAGVIAQEVESILPQSVTMTELKLNDGSILKDARGININGVVALLIEALKEEREIRESQRKIFEERLAALEKGTSNIS